MQILELRECYRASLVRDADGKDLEGGTLAKDVTGAKVAYSQIRQDGVLADRLDAEGDKIPLTVEAERWHALGVVSPLRGNDHLWLIEPRADDTDARTFQATLAKFWPNVARNDIGDTEGFTVQRPSVEHSPDLRLVEA